MIWDKFKDSFDTSYHGRIKKFIESSDCDKLYTHLKERSRLGAKIAPNSFLTWRIFKELPLNKIKVVILGLDPYNKFIDGKSIADGISMSCSITRTLQPTLDQFYTGIEKELYEGFNPNYIQEPDLMYLVEQGVFLGNAAYTTEMGKPGIHLPYWEPFQKFFFEEIIGYSGIPVLFLGKDAGLLEKYVSPNCPIFKASHPASAAYSKSEWDTKGVFGEINTLLKKTNGDSINWLKLADNEDIPF